MSTELQRLAKAADFEVLSNGDVMSLAKDELITLRLARFAALVAEHCAGICAGHAAELASDDWNSCTRHCAGAIRAAFKEAP